MASYFRRGRLCKNDKTNTRHRPSPPEQPPPNIFGATGTAVCHACKYPIARLDRHILVRLQNHRRYHIPCFVCFHCQVPINPKHEEFCYSQSIPNRSMNIKAATVGGVGNDDKHKRANKKADDHTVCAANDYHGRVLDHHRQQLATAGGDGEDNSDDRTTTAHPRDIDDEHPFHRACFAHHFGWTCVVCEQPLPMETTPIVSFDGNAVDDTSVPSAVAGSRRRATKVKFLKHPFFGNERVCPHHVDGTTPAASNTLMLQQHQRQEQVDHSIGGDSCGEQGSEDYDDKRYTIITTAGSSTIEAVAPERMIRQCAGCHRFEPSLASPAKHFVDVGDTNSGQCLCLACCRTVVTSSEDAIPLWNKVIDFFEGPLGLILPEDSYCTTSAGIKCGVTRQDLKSIPVMMVGMEALNDNMKELRNGHFGSNQILTRGMCLSEHDTTKSARNLQQEKDDDNQEVLTVGVVTAILCLIGLPSDLTASILAHEATHAYIKLHPNFSFSHTNPLPHKVEEGLAQLVAHLFLSDGLCYRPNTNTPRADTVLLDESEVGENVNCTRDGGECETMEDDSIPSDEKLRQYFRFCIETDDGVYGESFRLAAKAYAKMGLQELLYYVALHHCFPPL